MLHVSSHCRPTDKVERACGHAGWFATVLPRSKRWDATAVVAPVIARSRVFGSLKFPPSFDAHVLSGSEAKTVGRV